MEVHQGTPLNIQIGFICSWMEYIHHFLLRCTWDIDIKGYHCDNQYVVVAVNIQNRAFPILKVNTRLCTYYFTTHLYPRACHMIWYWVRDLRRIKYRGAVWCLRPQVLQLQCRLCLAWSHVAHLHQWPLSKICFDKLSGLSVDSVRWPSVCWNPLSRIQWLS